MMRETDTVMTELIQTLKQRKTEVIAQIEQYFSQEKAKIQEEEARWREKQQICEDLLRISGAKEADEELLKNSAYVTEGLVKISEGTKFEELRMINSLDTILHVTDDKGVPTADVNHEELKRFFLSYINVSEYKKQQYRC